MSNHKYKLHWAPDAVVYTVDQFRDWMFGAVQGERCLYHVGQMLTDQVDRPHLKLLGDYAVLMSGFDAVVITQRRIEDGMYQYFAARRDFKVRNLPKSVALGDIKVRIFLSLRAVHRRAAGVSAIRSIRAELACSIEEAQAIMAEMIRDDLVTDTKPPVITKAGKAALI